MAYDLLLALTYGMFFYFRLVRFKIVKVADHYYYYDYYFRGLQQPLTNDQA